MDIVMPAADRTCCAAATDHANDVAEASEVADATAIRRLYAGSLPSRLHERAQLKRELDAQGSRGRSTALSSAMTCHCSPAPLTWCGLHWATSRMRPPGPRVT